MHFYVLNHEATFQDLKKYNYPNQKIGVLIYIENEDGEILLQQRGRKSRDENGLYETIGGKFERKDSDFKSSIIREIKEEVGTDIKLELKDVTGIYHCYKQDIHWIFVVYFARYMGGNIKVMEPEKCMGYKFFSYEDAMNSELIAENCKYLIKSIKE